MKVVAIIALALGAVFVLYVLLVILWCCLHVYLYEGGFPCTRRRRKK